MRAFVFLEVEVSLSVLAILNLTMQSCMNCIILFVDMRQ